MPIRIPWTKHEVALLIDACIRFDTTQRARTEVIKDLSQKLRELAIKNKIEIDDIYRNENGISIQFQLMHGLLHNEVSGLRNSSKLFVEMKDLYYQDKSQYDKILQEAQMMLESNKKNQDSFVEWLSTQVSPAQLSELYMVYDKIDKFCIQRGILKKSLIETNDIKVVNKVLKTVEQNKVFRFTHKREINKIVSAVRYYYTYIKNQEDTKNDTQIGHTVMPLTDEYAKNVTEVPGRDKRRDSYNNNTVEVIKNKENSSLTRTRQDEILLQKYPIAYKKIMDSLRHSLDVVGEKGVTINAIYENIKHIVRMDSIEEILEKASWSKKNGSRYIYTEEILEKSEVTEENVNNTAGEIPKEQIDVQKVDFCNLTNLAFTKPTSFSYFGETVTDLRSWTDLYVKFIGLIHEDYPNRMPVGEYFHGASRIDFGDYAISKEMVAPKQISDNLYVETNLSATNIVGKIKALLDHCLVDYNNVDICYRMNKSQVDKNDKANAFDETDVLSLYSKWLFEEKEMAEATARGYASSVKVISEKAQEWNILDKLIYNITDKDELKNSVDTLFGNQDFQKYNEGQHNRFTASLNRFMEYMGITMTYGRNPYTEKENEFFEWLLKEKGLSLSTCRAYKSGLNMAIRFIQSHNFIEKSIFELDDDKIKTLFEKLLKDSDFSDFSDENYNRPKSAMYKYLEFISGSVVDVKETIDIDLTPYEIILQEAFPKGFRLESAIEIKKFKRHWNSLNDEDIDFDDEKIGQYIKYCGVVYDGRVYSPSSMISEELEMKLFSYINNSFSSGVSALYFEALFNEFSDDFLEHCMYNAEMLKEYIAFVNNGRYHINDNFISKDANVTVDPTDEVKRCLIDVATPMSYDELYEKLSHIAPQKIKQILNFNSDFISNGRSEYFHIDITVLTEDYLDDISAIIIDAINDKKFMGGNELIEAISGKYPYIIENNSTISELGLRNAIAYKLKSKFAFEGNIISSNNERLSMMDVFAEFCKKRSSFTLDELKMLKQELNTIIYFDTVYENSLRISQTNFVSKEQACFDIAATDLAIDRFCIGDYISLDKINQFGSFPDAGFQWNSYLLEHYVAMYSANYKLIHCTFNETACVGGIVKKSSHIETFDDLITDALSNSYIELEKEAALQFLCDEGYLARRHYSGIGEVLIKANELRNQKGN